MATKEIYVGNIPKGTALDKVKELFAEFSPTYGDNFEAPYGFLTVAADKADALCAKEYEIDSTKLQVNVARGKDSTHRYFLDSRNTKGALGELSEEVVKTYFSQFGEVAVCQIMAHKGIGWLEMAKDDSNDAVSGLAWKHHEIDGHEINVKEDGPRRNGPWKRKRKWGKWNKNKKQKN